MTQGNQTSRWEELSLKGWRDRTARAVSGLTLFLALSGLAIFLFPPSVFNQHAVIVHTAAGVLFLVPLLGYSLRHLRVYWGYPLTQTKFTGWVAGAMLAACVVSGVVLTIDAAFGRRIVYLWRTVHIVTTFGLLFFVAPHIVAIVLRDRKREAGARLSGLLAGARGFALGTAAWTVGGLAVVCAFTVLVRPVVFENAFPAGYDENPTGKGPFAPSLAQTVSGGPYAAASLAGAETCGTSRCHEQIYREWLPSAHRYSTMDAAFQVIQDVMAKQNGPVSTRYCAGCHDPISLFSGTKYIGVENLSDLDGYQEGVSCLVCHAIEQTDVKGNANYVIGQPPRYVYEYSDNPVAVFLSGFLIRAYPQQHVETLSRRMFKAPEFCAACHKQFIDEEVNQVGWVQLQNQYDNWKSSRWNHPGEPERTIECRECHMPLLDSYDPASGDEADFNRSAGDGKHRSHAFLGANQFMPLVCKLEDAEEHCRQVEAWLRGEIEIPEIAERWREGPAVPIQLELPEEASPGSTVPVRVHLVNNKVGHDFPTGPLDIIQAWVEIEVTDDQGRVVFHSGTTDERHFVETGSFMLKAEPVDRYGNLIDRHNLWEMVGVRFKRSMFPGAAEVASYEFSCPGAMKEPREERPRTEEQQLAIPEAASGTLHVRARLQYRKCDQYLLNFAFGEDAGLTAPITTMSEAEGTIRIRSVKTAGD